MARFVLNGRDARVTALAAQTQAPNQAGLVVLDVAQQYGSMQALAPVSFRVLPGQCAVIVGPNGSGKSTLLRIISGITHPTQGTAQFHGRDTRVIRQKTPQTLSTMLASMPYYRDLTIAEHLTLMTQAWGPPNLSGSAPELLDLTGLARVQHQFPGELSSGELQMFTLVCGCIRPAGLLVLDEPEQRLDTQWRTICAGLLGRMKHLGRAIVVATHDAHLGEALADHTIRLHRSRP